VGAIECSDVSPDGELWQDAVPLPLEQALLAVRVNLDSTYGGMSEKDAAEDTSPSSRKKM
jgi:hypothetical protein